MARRGPESPLLGEELDRQSTTPSSSRRRTFTSPAVLAASGSVLTNKYAEGYPGRRYYGGNQIIDEVEDLARERAKSCSGPSSQRPAPRRANANLGVYQALLEPGDTVLAMRLDHGGHLTHGSPASITSKVWHFVSYGLTGASGDPDTPGRGHRPGPGRPPGQDRAPEADRWRGRTAYARTIDPVALPRDPPTRSGPTSMFDGAHPAGLIAGGVHPSPVGIADSMTFTTHKTLRGTARRGDRVPGRPGQTHRLGDLPWPPGRPLEHVVAPRRWRSPRRYSGLPPLRRPGGGNAKALATSLKASGLPAGVGGHRQPHGAGRPASLRRRADRQGGPRGPRPRGHHLQPHTIPGRPALGVHHLRPAARHAGGDDGGDGYGRDGDHRGADQPHPVAAIRPRVPSPPSGRRSPSCARLPALPLAHGRGSGRG